MTRRWRRDDIFGVTIVTGCQTVYHDRYRGPGGCVFMFWRGDYLAAAWTPTESWEHRYKTEAAARRAVEGWLERRTHADHR